MPRHPFTWKTLASSRPALAVIHRSFRATGAEFTFLDLKQDALLLFSWSGEMTLQGAVHPVEDGTIAWIPVNYRRVFTTRSSGWHRVINFKPTPGTAPMVLPARPDARPLSGPFDEALANFPTQPERSEILAWELLWRIVDLENLGDSRPHASRLVREAIQFMEWGLSGTVRFSSLARQLGVTQAHFTRTFHREVAVAPATYLRKRRMALAKMLLTTTNQPIGEVGRACGVPDAQAFNKMVRREWGQSPRSLRKH